MRSVINQITKNPRQLFIVIITCIIAFLSIWYSFFYKNISETYRNSLVLEKNVTKDLNKYKGSCDPFIIKFKLMIFLIFLRLTIILLKNLKTKREHMLRFNKDAIIDVLFVSFPLVVAIIEVFQLKL